MVSAGNLCSKASSIDCQIACVAARVLKEGFVIEHAFILLSLNLQQPLVAARIAPNAGDGAASLRGIGKSHGGQRPWMGFAA